MVERRFPIETPNTERAKILNTPTLAQNGLDSFIIIRADADRHSLSDDNDNDFKPVNSPSSRVLPNSCVGSTNDVFSASLGKTIAKPPVYSDQLFTSLSRSKQTPGI